MPSIIDAAWCVIKRGDYYLREGSPQWTLIRSRAAILPSRAVAQTFLRDFPEDFQDAVILPYALEEPSA